MFRVVVGGWKSHVFTIQIRKPRQHYLGVREVVYIVVCDKDMKALKAKITAVFLSVSNFNGKVHRTPYLVYIHIIRQYINAHP